MITAKVTPMLRTVTASIYLAAVFAAHAALAQDFPVKPIRMIVGFSAGGGSDFAARIAGPKITEVLGQPVVVDNRTGANGAIAAEIAAKAPPDGYTLMMLAIAQAIGAAHGTKLPYDLLRDFAAVVIDRIAAALAKGMQSPEVRQRVASDGSEAMGSSPSEFDRFLMSEMTRFRNVIRDAGIKPE